MNYSKNITEHQSVNELRRRIKECKSTLLNLLDDWHFFQNVLQPRIMFIYETFFGDLEAELHNKTRSAAELERRIELLYYKINKGEPITEKTIEFINNLVNKEFERYRADLNNANISFDKKNNEQIDIIINDLDIGYIYRQLVKRLHPDINGYTEEFEKYWGNVQDAYQHNNRHRLRMFFKILCVDEDGFIDSNMNEELKLRNEVKELELNIDMEKRKIDRMKRQEPFIFEDKLKDFSWIEKRQGILKEKISYLERQIQQNESLLKAITVNSELTPSKSSNNKSYHFHNDFFQTAYGI
jgi:hypothetical protein